MEFRPLSPEVGVEVLDMDANALDDETFAEIFQAWCARGVLLFRNQRLDGPGQRAVRGDALRGGLRRHRA